jgi:pteridine reductase
MSSDAKKVALVTGGAKRVGRAIVERLVQAGYVVAFTYYSSFEDSDSLTEWAIDAGHGAYSIVADLTEPSIFIPNVLSAIRDRYGRLDVLVNNASIYEPSALEGTNLEQMRRFMAIHFESPLLLAQAFAPMLRAARGHVINMLDLLAERPWPQYLAYSASKAALANLTLGLARELAPDVTVNGIAPGVVEWPDGYPDVEKQRYLKRVPLQRPGTPQDVAELVHFLVTFGTYLTGQILRLDGGRSIT